MGHSFHFLLRWRIIFYLNCANFFERKKKLAVADDAHSSKKLKGYKYYVGNFGLSGKNLYNMLLPVNGCCFCREILSSSLKLPFVSKRAVRHGYWWWALNDRSFTKSLLSILKNLWPKQVRKALHLIGTQTKLSITTVVTSDAAGKWNRSNSQTYVLVTFSAQRKFTHKCADYGLTMFWIIPFAICASRKHGSTSIMSALLHPSGFRGVMVNLPWGEFRHETITLIVYNLMKTNACVQSYLLFYFGISWPTKPKINLDITPCWSRIWVCVWRKWSWTVSYRCNTAFQRRIANFQKNFLRIVF